MFYSAALILGNRVHEISVARSWIRNLFQLTVYCIQIEDPLCFFATNKLPVEGPDSRRSFLIGKLDVGPVRLDKIARNGERNLVVDWCASRRPVVPPCNRLSITYEQCLIDGGAYEIKTGSNMNYLGCDPRDFTHVHGVYIHAI